MAKVLIDGIDMAGAVEFDAVRGAEFDGLAVKPTAANNQLDSHLADDGGRQ